MKAFYTNIARFVKGAMFVGLVGFGFTAANAQTFVYDGIIYKASGAKLTVQKPGTKVTVGEAGPTEYAGDLVIPDEIKYNGKTYTVTSVGNAFKDQKNLTSLVMSNTVTTISRGCFQGDSILRTVVLSNAITTYAGDLFNSCKSLEEISIPGAAKEIASNQFKGCVSLKKITFEAGDTPLELSAAAFAEGGTSALEEVVINRQIGSKYTDMATKPFRGAKALKTVTLGGTLTSVSDIVLRNDPCAEDR